MPETISWHLRLHGPQTLAALCLRFGIITSDDPVYEGDELLAFLDAVRDETLDLVVPLTDGRLAHALSLLDGAVLTERVTSDTAGRDELWISPSLRPLQDLLAEAPLALAEGGQLERSATYARVLKGPRGWLPAVAPGDLLAFTIRQGVVSVDRVSDDIELAHPALRRMRGILSMHTTFPDNEDPRLHINVTRTIATARLEAPDLLSAPTLPLQELLSEPIDDRTPDMWRDFMAWRQDDTVSFSLEGMPSGLYSELNRRAHRYAMSLDQFIIAVLGHLAWRTPFAEDMSTWEDWDPERAGLLPSPRPHAIDPADAG